MATSLRRIISADSHVIEPVDLWENAVGKRLGEWCPRIIHEHAGKKGRFFFTGAQVLYIDDVDREAADKGLRECGYIPERRVEFQDEAHIDAELMNATLMLLIMQGEYKPAVRAAAQVYNDWCQEFCSYAPKRLIGIAMIPMDDVEWAVAEMERVARNGMRGAIINTQPPVGAPPYRDPVYEPFWAAAQDLDFPIALHIITGRVPDPFHFHTQKEQASTIDVMLQLYYEAMAPLGSEFIFGGVLDRFPKLKLMCSEFEISWLPNFMYRLDQMQQGFGARLPWLPTLKMKASDYLRHRVWHGMIDDPLGRQAIEHIGVSQILWGSDFPHVRSIGLETQERVAKLFEGMPDADQDRLVAGNVAKLFSL
jgi:predicted TIM-barrel fold metal-dependent hydrolase